MEAVISPSSETLRITCVCRNAPSSSRCACTSRSFGTSSGIRERHSSPVAGFMSVRVQGRHPIANDLLAADRPLQPRVLGGQHPDDAHVRTIRGRQGAGLGLCASGHGLSSRSVQGICPACSTPSPSIPPPPAGASLPDPLGENHTQG